VVRALPEVQGIVGSYLRLGLAIGRHIDGFVDAYYGPAEFARLAEAEGPRPPQALEAEARELLAALDSGVPLGEPGEDTSGESPARRRFLRAQVLGLLTSARLLGGAQIGYADEVEACYGVRPQRVPEELILAAHKNLEEVVPGSGPLAARYIAWRESQAVPPERLEAAIASLAEDLRERTARAFGLPEGESVEFVLVERQPWSGFNYYLGNLRSRVAINVDLPVLSTSLAHLVAHEAYPGHHTEHSRKEVGLVRRRRFLEESIFLVGTPQCLIAEGLADLGLEVVMGRRPEALVAEHLRPLGIAYDPDTVAVVAVAGEALAAVRANAAFRLHEDGAEPEVVIAEVARLGLLPPERAKKSVEFLLDPTWRSYISCYVEGLPLCRRYVDGKPERFERLITEQCVPADLGATTTAA
jgi:hypothetical protein